MLPLESRIVNKPLNFAVVVIDMQPDFLVNLGFFERRRLVRSQSRVLNYCAANGVPVAVLEDKSYGFMPTIDRICKLVGKVERSSFIEKWGADGFLYSGLGWQLNNWHVRAVLIMGIYSSACVKETTKTALRKGFSVFTHPALIADTPYSDKNDKNPTEWYQKNNLFLPRDTASSLFSLS